MTLIFSKSISLKTRPASPRLSLPYDSVQAPQNYPQTHAQSDSPPSRPCSPPLVETPSPPSRVIGLGISGLYRKNAYGTSSYSDSEEEPFDGLGFVGFAARDHDDVHITEHDTNNGVAQLSTTFMRELAYTWHSDPFHTRALGTIAESEHENEDEWKYQQPYMPYKNNDLHEVEFAMTLLSSPPLKSERDSASQCLHRHRKCGGCGDGDMSGRSGQIINSPTMASTSKPTSKQPHQRRPLRQSASNLDPGSYRSSLSPTSSPKLTSPSHETTPGREDEKNVKVNARSTSGPSITRCDVVIGTASALENDRQTQEELLVSGEGIQIAKKAKGRPKSRHWR